MLPASAAFAVRTAAWLHGLDVEAANPVQVAVPATCKLRSRVGLQVLHLDVEQEVQLIRGIRATSLSRTLLDLCARLPAAEALAVLDMAICGRLTSGQHLCRYADIAKGRPGAARLRSLANFAAPAESPMETRLRWLLVKSGLPKPEVQIDLHDDQGRFVGRADLYYPVAHLVIEFDGANHRDRLVADDRRQNQLVGAGYRILRFTASDFYGRPEAVVAQIRATLEYPRARPTCG